MQKKEYTSKQLRMSSIAKALGHPARIAIMEYLSKTPGCICGDIVEVLPLAQSTVSQHLKELKNVGLIKGNVEGNAICYCIDQEALLGFKEYIFQISSANTENTTC